MNWDRLMSIDLKGTALCMKWELQQMIRQGGGGSIVNISSVSGFRPQPSTPAYVAAKHGVNGLTKVAAVENGALDIRVNAVAPGAIELSGGERQRVAIARALIGSPELVLADEPTAALDDDRGRDVMALLADLSEQHRTATVLVTHAPHQLARRHRTLYLRGGCLSAVEPPDARRT